MIAMTQPNSAGTPRGNPNYYNDKLRVTVDVEELRGHHVVRVGRFLLTAKRFSHDGKIILHFENSMSSLGDGWDRLGRNGVIKIPVSTDKVRGFLEGCVYALYMFRW